ncbi:hypothetical protein MRBLPD1_004482 [Pseudomonas brassicacearum]|uniref:hypothetical protein n=1 Tax=Pseudomonas brassicacearum TaxID=930166 RepID=UPI0034651EBC
MSTHTFNPIAAPSDEDDFDSPYLPYHKAPIAEQDCTDERLAKFIEQEMKVEFSIRGYNHWIEAARYPLTKIDPSERLRLITLCHLMSKLTPQWQRLFEFNQAGILDAQRPQGIANEILQRNHLVKELANGLLFDGMSESDPSRKVFEDLMCNQHGVFGDQITMGLASVIGALTPYLNNIQRQRVYDHNKLKGYSDPERGYASWPDSVPTDFGFDDAVGAAQALLDEVCDSYGEDQDEESIRSRLLKDAVLADENRYWMGVADSHTEVLENIRKFIPKNIAELKFPESEAEVSAAVRNLFGIDRRVVTKTLVQEGRVLLDLYLRYALLDQPSESRYPRELAIAAAVALQMRRCKAKWPVKVHGQGTRNRSAYQAFKALAAPVLAGAPEPIDPALRVLLCGAVSMALTIESDYGMGTFKAATEHGSLKIRRTEFFAQIPKRLRMYSAPTVVMILQCFADTLNAAPPTNPLHASVQQHA